MIPPLDFRILSALIHDGDDAGSFLVQQAKRFLIEDRNLSSGVKKLLELYPWFSPYLYQDDVPDYTCKTGADSWHIQLPV